VSPMEAAYIAGFFDGEGCVSIARLTDIRRVKPRITIVQKDPTTLRWIQVRLGGNLHKRPNGVWVLAFDSAVDIRRFVKATYPYLQLKKGKAKVAYHLASTIQPRSMATDGRFLPLNPAVLHKRRRWLVKWKQLNS